VQSSTSTIFPGVTSPDPPLKGRGKEGRREGLGGKGWGGEGWGEGVWKEGERKDRGGRGEKGKREGAGRRRDEKE
jgi:hypothetical protein